MRTFVFALLSAFAFVVGPLLGVLHHLAVPHRQCEEHGEIIEGHGVVAEHHDGGVAYTDAEADEHGKHGCVFHALAGGPGWAAGAPALASALAAWSENAELLGGASGAGRPVFTGACSARGPPRAA